MVRLLQSTWMTMLIGALIFFATTAALLKPVQMEGVAGAGEIVAHPISNEPSWKFRNPEMDQWIAEIKNEKEALDIRAQQLKELETRLNAERQEIATVTQTVYQLQSDFDQNVIRLKSQDTEHLKRQVKLISSMSPEGAATTLSEMSDDDIVRLLVTMKPADASVLIENMSKQGKEQAKHAALLIDRISRTLPPTN
jgi:flagellar motility protein MotE (MotC chaperone)